MSKVENTKCRYVDKVALVSAGALGIGRAIVTGMAREGAQVVFSDINVAAGESLQDELRDLGLKVLFREGDGTDEDFVRDVVSSTVGQFGGLHVGVNNIGNFAQGDDHTKTMDDTSLEMWLGTINQNLTSCFLAMKYQIAHMKRAGGGAIANTSSLGGIRIVDVASPSYMAAKAGVNHLSRHVAVRYAEHGIRCNVIAPGMTATPALIASFPDVADRDAFAGTRQPMGRAVETREIADAFIWVCSEEASMVTGQIIAVDGGWSAT